MPEAEIRAEEVQMTMMEHLAELRRRLIISFVSIGVGAIVAWVLYPQIIEFLLEPYCDTLQTGEQCQLYVRNPLEPFSVRLTIAGYGGIIFAMPMILWQVWCFVAPGLHSNEKALRSSVHCRCAPAGRPWSRSRVLEYSAGARVP